MGVTSVFGKFNEEILKKNFKTLKAYFLIRLKYFEKIKINAVQNVQTLQYILFAAVVKCFACLFVAVVLFWFFLCDVSFVGLLLLSCYRHSGGCVVIVRAYLLSPQQ